MAKSKAVKVRKWVTCAEPGCKRRAGTSQPYCGEHQKKFEKAIAAAAKKRKGKPKNKPSTVSERGTYWKDRKKGTRKKKPLASSAWVKDPGSRLLKAHCDKCGYTIRLSRKWIEVRRPLCPVCMKNMVTELDGLIDADPRQLKLKGGV